MTTPQDVGPAIATCGRRCLLAAALLCLAGCSSGTRGGQDAGDGSEAATDAVDRAEETVDVLDAVDKVDKVDGAGETVDVVDISPELEASSVDAVDISPELDAGSVDAVDGMDGAQETVDAVDGTGETLDVVDSADAGDAPDSGMPDVPPPPCGTWSAGPGQAEPFLPDAESSDNVVTTIEGYLTLPPSAQAGKFLWVPLLGDDTVSKLEMTLGQEVARYKVCDNPARAAVDLWGNLWVACFDDGAIVKIAGHITNCVDKNTDGLISTSTDANANGKIDADEELAAGLDECVVFTLYPGGKSQAGIGVDLENHVWVADREEQALRRLSPDTGAVLQSEPLPFEPFGLVVGPDDLVYVLEREACSLSVFDPGIMMMLQYDPPPLMCQHKLYGMTFDASGKLWLTMAPNYVVRFDNPGFTMIPLAEGLGDVKGLVGSPDGLLYVGHHTELCQAGSSISVFDPIIEFEVNSLTVDAGIATGVSSVQLDSDGRAWALNICTDDLVGFNPGTGQKAGKIQVGNDPFAYSNLAATVLGPAQPDSGYYRHVFGALDADEAWSTMSLALAGGGFVKVRVRTAATIPQLNGAAWSAPVGPFPPEKFPLDLSALGLPGSFLEVEVTLYSDGGTAPILKSISATCETMP